MGNIGWDDFVAAETSIGGQAATEWLYARGLCAIVGGWDVTIRLPADDATLHVAITSSEWGIELRRGAQASWIRFTDQAFVHERDDFALIQQVPASLERLGELVRELEERHGIAFDRRRAEVETNIANAAPKLRRWLEFAI
jgi:hypothetical protein